MFGASKHRYRLHAPASLAAVCQFEGRHAIALPSDYRQFLTEISNGGAGPNYGVIPIERAAVGQVPSAPFQLAEFECAPDMSMECDPSHGAVWLSDNGCGTFDVMAVRGNRSGSVWTILEDTQCWVCDSFEQWYLGWLQSAIKTIQREPLLKRLRTGMHIDEVRGILGDELAPVPAGSRSAPYPVAFIDCNADFLFDSADRLLKIDHHAHIICPRIR